MSLDQYTQEQIKEFSLIEISYELLKEAKETMVFPDLAKKAAEVKGLSKKDLEERLAQFYTELNIDGRFLTIGDSRWGLKRWYPYDTVEDDATMQTKLKKKKSKKSLDDDDELDLDEYDDLDELDDTDLDAIDTDDALDLDEDLDDDIDLDEEDLDDDDDDLDLDEDEDDEEE